MLRLAILAALALVACSSGEATHDDARAATAGLPLKPGYYNQGESCSDVSNASIVLLGRSSINWSRAACELSAIEKTGANRWKAMQSCKDVQSETAEAPYPVFFDIQDETTFTHRFEGSTEPALYRYCAQSSLPEPWRSNDIGELER